jgi:hypothetical protein
MITIRTSVKNVDAVVQVLGRVQLDSLQRDVGDAMDLIAADAADYPPELPNQRYIRTGNLGRGWTDGNTLFQGGPTMLEAVRENSVEYAPDVMGAADQKAIFAGRWRTNEQLMDAWEARVAQMVEDGLDRILPR